MSLIEIQVPDIGDFDAVSVIEVLVSVGDSVDADQSLITLESDKASMEIPSTHAGVVKELKVNVGDEIGQGAVILTLEAAEGGDAAAEPPKAEPQQPESPKAEPPAPPPPPPASPAPEVVREAQAATPSQMPADKAPAGWRDEPVDEEGFRRSYASPAVRRFARELGVDLGKVKGTGRKGRITKEDVQNHVKAVLSRSVGPEASRGAGLPEMPEIDFSKFGPIERKPLSRIRKLSARNLHRSWLHVPHVTQHEEADITEMEAFRKEHSEAAKKRGFKLTPVAFQLKACAAALREMPEFNSSLSPDGEELIMKGYVNIGVAVDTPNGLVVPVLRDVDKKSLFELAQELIEISGRAREGKLMPADFQGGCFTISSLGGIGGTAFTPIVNAPEVAILGVSRSQMKPIWNGSEFVPRLMLPLSLSYDHRVIDGAKAARFVVYLAGVLGDLRRLLL